MFCNLSIIQKITKYLMTHVNYYVQFQTVDVQCRCSGFLGKVLVKIFNCAQKKNQTFYLSSFSSANKCLLKVGFYCAQLEQYPKAIEIFEQVCAQFTQFLNFNLALILSLQSEYFLSHQVATSTMDNPLLKYNAKEYFWKASLCHFIVDELNAKVSATALNVL